jgi:hypothetical protein
MYVPCALFALQWQFFVTDNCGNTTINTTYVQTPAIPIEPCCLPGYAADPDKQHGKCLADKDGKIYSLCGLIPPDKFWVRAGGCWLGG